MATTVKTQIDSIDRFLKAVGYSEKNAEANTEAGSIGGDTTHPIKDVDDSTEDATEGFRSTENTADVKADQGPASVENAKKAAARKRASVRKRADEHDPNGSASDDQIQIGTNKKPTGEDPSVETSSVKSEKEDTDTAHPASTDNSELDGNKYASMSTAQLYKISNDLGNRVLVALTKFADKADFMDDDDSDRNDSESESDSEVTEEKDAVDLAGQAGWELAGLLSGKFDKRAADSLVYSTLSEIIKTANDDADKAAVYLQSYHTELRKQAEGEEEAALAAMGGGGGDEAALAQAMMDGGGMGDGGMGDVGMGDGGGAGGMGDGGGDGADGGGDVEQLAAILDQLGISPEELEAAMSEHGSEGAGAGQPDAMASAPPSPDEEPKMEVEAAHKQAVAKKGAASKNVRDYIQEVLERSRR